MPLFRKKPVTIEARQLVAGIDLPGMDALVGWINADGQPGQSRAYHAGATPIYIRTLEGMMRAEIGDWIIKGIKGEFYPCKNDIFLATYEAV